MSFDFDTMIANVLVPVPGQRIEAVVPLGARIRSKRTGEDLGVVRGIVLRRPSKLFVGLTSRRVQADAADLEFID